MTWIILVIRYIFITEFKSAKVYIDTIHLVNVKLDRLVTYLKRLTKLLLHGNAQKWILL